MKLNIKSYNENGKIKSCSSNEFITIDFHFGNKKVHTIMFKCEEGTGCHNWEITKGKKQKGEECDVTTCGSEATHKLCDSCLNAQ